MSPEGSVRIHTLLRAMWDGNGLRVPGTVDGKLTPTQAVALARGYLLDFYGFESVMEFDPPLRPLEENPNRMG